MNKVFKSGAVVFLDTSSPDGYYFKYIGVVKKHFAKKKSCDFKVSVAYERNMDECYDNLEFDEEDIDYDSIRLATPEEEKILNDVISKLK